MRRECREHFPSPQQFSDPDMHHGTCVTHVQWCMPGSLVSGFFWSRWRGKRSRHSWRIRIWQEANEKWNRPWKLYDLYSLCHKRTCNQISMSLEVNISNFSTPTQHLKNIKSLLRLADASVIAIPKRLWLNECTFVIFGKLIKLSSSFEIALHARVENRQIDDKWPSSIHK